MMNARWVLALAVLLAASHASAVVVYSNAEPSNDTLTSIFPSVNTFDQNGPPSDPWTAVGDRISLDGTARIGQTATIQYFGIIADEVLDPSSTGVFDATLSFYEVGMPVGAPIGSSFTVSGNVVSNFGIGEVTFNLGGLTLPDELIFMVSFANITDGFDVALNLFEPPTIGSSDNTFFIAQDANTFGVATTGVPNIDPMIDNFYFVLDAVAVPESPAWPVACVCVALVAGWRVGAKKWFLTQQEV